MNQTEARRHVAAQTGVDITRLSSLLDTAPATALHWTYIAGQIGHASAQELASMCIRFGALVATNPFN